MRKRLSIALSALLLTTPFTLHSTDIYASSRGEMKIHASLNPNIIPGDRKLGSTVVVVSAPAWKDDIRIVTECEHRESVLYRETKGEKTVSVIELVFPTSCEEKNISLGDRVNVFTDTAFDLSLGSLSGLENTLINTDSEKLVSIMRWQSLPTGNTGGTVAEKLAHLQTLYRNLDTTLRSDIARSLLTDREDAEYISPVKGYSLPVKDKLIPMAGRPYRRDTTDGIHHGWDIMAPLGTPVQALSKGKIIRIIDTWSWADFKRMQKGQLTDDDRLRNLDIFRGNQVWLQGMDGNVTFYSHLSRVAPDIAVGTTVEKWTSLGNIGTTGVPDRHYKDIHLHFEIQMNPFREDMKNPNYLDIMRWRYIGEGLGRNEIRKRMQEVFE